MFQSWRFKLREAEEALKAGRLDEARRKLGEGDLIEYLPGKRLAAKVASRLAQRAGQQAVGADLESGWRDLEAAISLVGQTDELVAARQMLLEASAGDTEKRLQAGDLVGAIGQVESLERRGVIAPALQTLREVARRMQSAANLCRRGRFSDAEAQLAAAMAMRPGLAVLQEQRAACRDKLQQWRRLTDLLHRALSDAQWSDAVSLAGQLLDLAPESRLARDARKRAWQEVGAGAVDWHSGQVTQAWSPACPRAAQSAGGACAVAEAASGPRFLLWVDGVGGYLVCLADEVLIGQASLGNSVDVPILGDLSRRHATIRREGEGYVIQPFHVIRVDGRSVQNKTLLSDGDEIELGAGVRLRFRRPHALSASARLDLLSRHRTQPYADGVLLMAESCVLGPRWQNHVVCRHWSGDVVLYRQEDELYCRAMESIEVDGQLVDGRGRLGGNSHVVGSDFSLSLEELDKCSIQPLL